MHSTLALSHAEQAGNLPSHFCLRLRQRVHDEMARATLYCGCSGRGDAAWEGDGFERPPLVGGAGCEKVDPDDVGGYGAKWLEVSDDVRLAVGAFMVDDVG
jgi:hypothetical protein